MNVRIYLNNSNFINILYRKNSACIMSLDRESEFYAINSHFYNVGFEEDSNQTLTQYDHALFSSINNGDIYFENTTCILSKYKKFCFT
jgi:hypothetical protein